MRIERLPRDPLISTPDSPEFADPREIRVEVLDCAATDPARAHTSAGDFAWLLAEATMVDAEWSQRDASEP